MLDCVIRSLFSFMIYHRVCNTINTTGTASAAETAYPSGAPEFTPVFGGFVLLDLQFYLAIALATGSKCGHHAHIHTENDHEYVKKGTVYSMWSFQWE